MFQLNDLFQLYHQSINFLFVYILEAHAEDEWPISSARWTPNNIPVRYDQTRTIEQRIKVAQDFCRDFQVQMPLVLDKPGDDLFEKLYASWPVRIYILDQEHRLIYKAQPAENMLELNELRSWLNSTTIIN